MYVSYLEIECNMTQTQCRPFVVDDRRHQHGILPPLDAIPIQMKFSGRTVYCHWNYRSNFAWRGDYDGSIYIASFFSFWRHSYFPFQLSCPPPPHTYEVVVGSKRLSRIFLFSVRCHRQPFGDWMPLRSASIIGSPHQKRTWTNFQNF